MCNRERQQDELASLQSILETEEILFVDKITDEPTECKLRIFPPPQLLQVKYIILYRPGGPNEYNTFSIKHLPPIELHLKLPLDYPSKGPPQFRLNINWLPPWKSSLVCQQLDQLWTKNSSNEILYVWYDFLKNDLLEYLQIQEWLDMSFFFKLHTNRFYSSYFRYSDKRVLKSYEMYLHPRDRLVKYSKFRDIAVFQNTYVTCGICFDNFFGRACMYFEGCTHVYCKDCFKKYVESKLQNENAASISCPQTNCSVLIKPSDVKELDIKLCEKYENRSLQMALNNMKDIILCPRKSCNLPVIKEETESLARCSCGYNFCVYCLKVYHGVASCLNSEKNDKIYEEYMAANVVQKKAMVKKYGNKQIQAILQEKLNEKYIEDNTKLCPSCNIPLVKESGCNKVTCAICQSNICWLCNTKIHEKNAYDHFAKGNTCQGLLFTELPNDFDDVYLDEVFFD